MGKDQINPYLDSKDDKKTQVRDMFDSIAPKYDLLNHSLSMGIDKLWRRTLVSMINKSYGDAWGRVDILDVATGTADLAIAMRLGVAGARVSGVDLSPQMVEVGRKKLAERKLFDVELAVGDAESLPYADNSFDVVTSAFGVRNFEDTRAGLSQMVRVTRKGGEVMVLEFSKVTFAPLSWCYNLYFNHILPRIGRMVSKDPRAYEYLPESVDAFACGQDFIDIMQSVGLVDCSATKLSMGIATIYRGKKA